MNKQVEAMKLALEALWTTATPKTEHAIAALKEALAEQPAQQEHSDGWLQDGWLQDGGMLYRLTEGPGPCNKDEIFVSMADGSYSNEARTRRAGELLDRLRAPQPAQQEPVEPDKTQAYIDSLPDCDDKMVEQIHHWARQSYLRRRMATRGQAITAADAPDSHIIWAALRWAKENSPQPAQQQEAEPVAWVHICRKRPELRVLSFKEDEPHLKARGYKAHPLTFPQQAIEAAHNIKEKNT